MKNSLQTEGKVLKKVEMLVQTSGRKTKYAKVSGQKLDTMKEEESAGDNGNLHG